jgi:acyl carrier protein
MESVASEFSWVRDVLVRQFDIPEADVRVDARLREDLRLESLDLVDLVLVIEKHIGRRIESEDISAVRTVQDVLRLMERMRAHPVG